MSRIISLILLLSAWGVFCGCQKCNQMHIKYLERSNFLKIIRRGSYLIFATIILALEMQKNSSHSYNTLTDKRSTQRFPENQQMVFIFGINDICGYNLNFLLSEIFSRLIKVAPIYAFGLIKIYENQNHFSFRNS